MKCKPVYEFLLWDNCTNHCTFCFQRKNCINISSAKKSSILNETIKFLDSDKYVKGSHILLVGGELFDDVSIIDVWKSFFNSLMMKLLYNEIDLLYINTNLLYDDLGVIDELLSQISHYKLWNRLKFTTSYDLYGRFSTKQREDLFLKNLRYIKDTYPECNIVVNTILTKQTCEKILTNEFNVTEFMKGYRCYVNLIPYIIYDESLSASRSLIFDALKKVNDDSPSYIHDYITNMDLPQKKELYQYKDNQFVYSSCDYSDCGHSENFKMYSTSGTCYVCDLKLVFNRFI